MLPSFQLTGLHGNVDRANKSVHNEKTDLDRSRLSSSWIQMISVYIARRAKNKNDDVDPWYGKELTVTTVLK